jgi:hypothetical protein
MVGKSPRFSPAGVFQRSAEKIFFQYWKPEKTPKFGEKSGKDVSK